MKANSRKKMVRFVALLIVVILVVTSLSYVVFAAEEKQSYVDEQLDFLKKLILYIESEYVMDLDEKEIVEGIYKGFFETLDPYSVYYPERETYDDFVDSGSGE